MTVQNTRALRTNRSTRIACLGSVGLLALFASSAASAQDAVVAEQPALLDEVIVTARRESENVQNIPVAVQVVSGESIQQLAITQPAELTKLTPGLSVRLPDPSAPQIVLRGVRWTQASGTPAIPVYMNEIPFDPVQVLQTLYDVGQIEVLRGPQGTTRGAPSISGAVTITTRRPDFNEFGGYVYGQIGENDHQVLQGAVNIPLIADKLAVRIAGNYEDSEANGVRSINSADGPSLETRSWRASVRFEPTDTFSINATYQNLTQTGELYTHVAGSGSPGAQLPAPYPPGPNPFAPAGYNIGGRSSISPADRLSVQEEPNILYTDTDLFTVNASWDFFGQRLSYNFGDQKNNADPFGINIDPANALLGFSDNSLTTLGSNSHRWHEVRLSSIRGDHFFDYDIGYFNEQQRSDLTFRTIGFLLPGAFGNPFLGPSNPNVTAAAIDRYSLRSTTDIELDTHSYSFYANALLHLPYDTELSAGVRTINDRRPARVETTLSDTFAIAAPAVAFGGVCPAAFGLVDSPVYAGFCDAALPASSFGAVPTDVFDETETPTIWNVSLSRKFSEDVLGYATVGTSWRAGLPAINNPGLPSNLVFPNPEEATSYEIGIKSTFGSGLRINAALFRIDYKGQLNAFKGIPYFDPTTSSTRSTSEAFLANVDAVVNGIEASIFARPIDGLTLNLNVSYAKIESEGGTVPCAGPVSAANPINFCTTQKGEDLSAAAPFTASLNGNYTVPVGSLDGYLRFVVSYEGRNTSFGASEYSFEADAFTTVDLFAGLTSARGWDLGLYAKNVFDEYVTLTRNPLINSIAPEFGPTGLDVLTANQPREIGLTLRYAFGSR